MLQRAICSKILSSSCSIEEMRGFLSQEGWRKHHLLPKKWLFRCRLTRRRKQNVKCIAGTWSYISFQDNWSRQCQRIPFWKRRTFQVSTSSAISDSDLTLSMIIIHHVSGHSRRRWTPSKRQSMQQQFEYLRGVKGGIAKRYNLLRSMFEVHYTRGAEELWRVAQRRPEEGLLSLSLQIWEKWFSHRVQWVMSGWRTQACPLAGRSRGGSTVLTISGGSSE